MGGALSHGGERLASPWLNRLRPPAAPALRLLAIPHAGGAASAIAPWVREWPAQIELALAQFPGRDRRLRERPAADMGEVVGRLADAVTPLLDRPLMLFGHSLGALIAFELARELRRRGLLSPARLIVSCRCAPDEAPRAPQVSADAPEAEIVSELRRLSGTPPEVLGHAELMGVLVSIFRADLAVEASHRFAAEPPLDCAITAISGTADPDVSTGDMEHWRRHTASTFESRVFEGSHFDLPAVKAQVLAALEGYS
jgi:medium-chain acyl-[acyl-carrier-protein] hydrolase